MGWKIRFFLPFLSLARGGGREEEKKDKEN